MDPQPAAIDPDTIQLRPPQPGELSRLIVRHMQTVAREHGWDGRYEGHLMEAGARALLAADPARERFWVADRDGELLGCVGIVAQDATTAQVRMMFVEPGARGLGLGRRLLQTALGFCRDAGYRAVELWVFEVLAEARRLYASLGFRMIASQPWEGIGPVLQDETWRLELTGGSGERVSTGGGHGEGRQGHGGQAVAAEQQKA